MHGLVRVRAMIEANVRGKLVIVWDTGHII